MSETAVIVQCARGDCGVRASGLCSEGHVPLQACPNYGREIDHDEEFEEDTPHFVTQKSETENEGLIQLYKGEALTSEGVDELLRYRDATFIAIVGDSYSGKTTLIGALYERFMRGSFAGYLFSGSRTLLALEERLHFSRVESLRLTPDTPRTSLLDGTRYFHFAIKRDGAEAGPSKHLLISDRAGETYGVARNKPTSILPLTEVSRASRVVLLLDGARLTNPAERAGALQSVRQTLWSFLDNDVLDDSSSVQVVTTKFDLVQSNPSAIDIERFCAAFKEKLIADFALRLRALSFLNISARDPSLKIPEAHGLDVLLQDWSDAEKPMKAHAKRKFIANSEFQRLASRTPEAL